MEFFQYYSLSRTYLNVFSLYNNLNILQECISFLTQSDDYIDKTLKKKIFFFFFPKNYSQAVTLVASLDKKTAYSNYPPFDHTWVR